MIGLLKNRILAASAMMLGLNLAGGFAVMAPILVAFRNEFSGSAMALDLWPVIRPEVLAGFFVSHIQSITIFVVSAIVIFILYSFLWTFFSVGIYSIIIKRKDPGEESQGGRLRNFLRSSADLWPGFIKIAILSILIYALAAFIGLTLGQILSGLWRFFRVIMLLAFMLAASIYIQVLKVYLVDKTGTSVRDAIKNTRPILSKTAGRLLLGNFSVMTAGIVTALVFWFFLRLVRGYEWNTVLAILSIILEQAIVLAICLAQAVRINFNHTVITRGAEDALGGTQLGGV